jgi:hypothetical protein
MQSHLELTLDIESWRKMQRYPEHAIPVLRNSGLTSMGEPFWWCAGRYAACSTPSQEPGPTTIIDQSNPTGIRDFWRCPPRAMICQDVSSFLSLSPLGPWDLEKGGGSSSTALTVSVPNALHT